MGCTQSRVEQEAVTRCKERRQFMRDAVAQRNALAAAHSLYAMALKDVGSALNDYGQGEVLEVRQPLATSALADQLMPPPPPPPDEFAGTPLPPPPPPPPAAMLLQKASSMPNIGLPKLPVHSEGTIQEEDDDAEEGDGLKTTSGSRAQPGAPSAVSRDSAPSPLTHAENSNWQDQDAGWKDFFFRFEDSLPEISTGEPPPRTPEPGMNKPAPPPSPSPTSSPPPPKDEANDDLKSSQKPESISEESPEKETFQAATPLPPKAAKKPKESSQMAVAGWEAKRTRGGGADCWRI